MSERPSSIDSDRTRVFWDRFRTVAVRHGVPPKAVVWYERRVQQFIKAFAGTRLKDRTPEHVKGFLRQLLLSGGLADWQYLQAAAALELLYSELITAPTLTASPAGPAAGTLAPC